MPKENLQPERIEALQSAQNESAWKRLKSPENAPKRLESLESTWKYFEALRNEALLSDFKLFQVLRSALKRTEYSDLLFFPTQVLAAYCSKNCLCFQISTNFLKKKTITT